MTLGKGSPYSISSKQKINTVSSTEAELVGISDVMKLIIWTRLFIESQGYSVTDNVLYQDNQSTILLANNGKRSSTRNTKHINIRYFFITDNVREKNIRIEYCPTENMRADTLTKPLQGSAFVKYRKELLNLPSWHIYGNDRSVLIYDEITQVIYMMHMLWPYTIFIFRYTYMSAENKIVGEYDHVATYDSTEFNA